MRIKTLADLKRIPIGTRLRLVKSLMGPTSKLRIVAKVQSNSIAFDGDDIKPGHHSWLNLPKAADFEPTSNGFRIYDTWDPGGPGERREIGAEYVFEEAQNGC
jgi:hypothetical protein